MTGKKLVRYPDRTLERAWCEAGHVPKVMWEMRGPKNTNIAWLVCYLVNSRLVIVVTFSDGNGWTALVDTATIRVDATIASINHAIGIMSDDEFRKWTLPESVAPTGKDSREPLRR